jgi:hypothetical protein
MLPASVVAIFEFLAITLGLAAQAPPPANRPATVSGQILTKSGAPAVDARVVAIVAGGAQAAQVSMMSLARTDNEGRYRLEDVVPGVYYIAAGSLDELTYFPGVMSMSKATAVTVSGGAALKGMDFRLTVPQPVEISGRVVESALTASKATNLLVERLGLVASGARPAARVSGGAIAADGSFRVTIPQPGTYRLSAQPNGPEAIVMVEEEGLRGLEIRSTTVRHTIQMEDGGPLPIFDLVFTDARISEAPSVVRAGAPSVAGAMRSGEFRVTARGLPAAYSIKAFTASGVNLLAEPLRVGNSKGPVEIDLVLGRSASAPWASFDGRLTGAGAAKATDILLKSDLFRDEFRAQPAADGSFAFPKVLPGFYTIRVLAGSALTAILNVDVRGNTSVRIAPYTFREVSGRVSVDPVGALPLMVELIVVCPTSAESSLLSLEIVADLDAEGAFKATLPETGCLLTVVPEVSAQYLIKSAVYGEMDLTAPTGPFTVSGDTLLKVGLTASAGSARVRVRGQVTGDTRSLRRIILQSPAAGGGLRLSADSRRGALQVPVGADGVFDVALPPELFLTVAASQAAEPSPIILAAPNTRKVTIRATMADTTPGAKAPEVFILRIDGKVGQTLQFFGYSTNAVLKSDPAAPGGGTFTMVLPEGQFSLGIDFPEGMVRPPRVKSFTRGDIDLLRAPMSISILDSDVELNVVFEPAPVPGR